MTKPRWRALGDVHLALPPAPSPRRFGLTVGGVLEAAALFSLWRHPVLRAETMAAAGAALMLAALVRPASLAPLARGWERLGHALGWFNSRVLLTVLVVVVLWPIGVLSGWFGSDPLARRRRPGSLWTPYSARLRDVRHFERMF